MQLVLKPVELKRKVRFGPGSGRDREIAVLGQGAARALAFCGMSVYGSSALTRRRKKA
jgi:hypothetical protein